MTFKQPIEDAQLVTGDILSSRYSKYSVECVLGRGTFGKVAKCTRMEDSKTVAIKMIKKNHVEIAKQEVAVLKKMISLDPDKCNLVKWYSSFIDKEHICLEFEHLDKSLHDFMKERKYSPLPLKEIRPIVHQIASALNHLKDAKIMHTDLKLDNVMLVDQQREPFRVKVIDFGLARDVSAAKLGSCVQSIPFRSPEVLLGLPFTEAIDMWALGCMAATLYFGNLLFPGKSEYETIKYIVETQGQLPDTMLDHGLKTRTFFWRDSTNTFWKLKTTGMYCYDTGIQPKENRKFFFTSLDDLLDVGDISCPNKTVDSYDKLMFVNMLKGMLKLEAMKRITPQQVLEHPFISMVHIANGYYHSHHVWSCFEMMKVCQKNIGSSDTQTVSGSQNSFRTNNPIQQNGPSHVEERNFVQPHHTNLHHCVQPSDMKKMGPGQDSGSHYYNRVDDINQYAYRSRPAGYNHYPGVHPSNKMKTGSCQDSGSHNYKKVDNVNQYAYRSRSAGYNHHYCNIFDKCMTGRMYDCMIAVSSYSHHPGVRPD
nr:PREDICTED: homeodomain-interacting protein kinase 2-like [Paralichthys olivaceus]